ncbi:MAG: RluA family pseudouridine synthase [Humidesulfovibrio sp.]|uniref:RluA family pseudouridine synthase n=1 Tax=Humidesulfovibrio sp. TaxID=2910988 RepID=UPI00273690B7|nr:RluA family pseudouridine synthase [Humidesulfovibrio sp.]MDP2849102.1 RluA family pseudouridine synthase [Humidesulfovibrio sp.]
MTWQTDAGQSREILVDAALEGTRLDRVLETLLPGSGLRLRRRLIENGRVLIEGRPAPASLKLRAGQRLSLLPESAKGGTEPSSNVADNETPEGFGHEAAESTRPAARPVIRIVERTKDYAALDKPAGLHSAALAGGGGQSLEAMLPELFPGITPRLLNRLDYLTSGLVLVSLNGRAAKVFAALKPKDVVKEYMAVVNGALDEPLQLKRKLDTDDRKRTRVLGRMENDARGWTLVWPEARLAGGRTLVRVRIQAGARHQIRAHLAAANLPILGDPLYGEPGAEKETGGRLYLHHRRLEFQGFKAFRQPPWLKELKRLETARAEGAETELD